nr:hypothetical protein [Angustibacter aerolatus]
MLRVSSARRPSTCYPARVQHANPAGATDFWFSARKAVSLMERIADRTARNEPRHRLHPVPRAERRRRPARRVQPAGRGRPAGAHQGHGQPAGSSLASAAGLLVRSPSPTSRRDWLISLTRKGREPGAPGCADAARGPGTGLRRGRRRRACAPASTSCTDWSTGSTRRALPSADRTSQAPRVASGVRLA